MTDYKDNKSNIRIIVLNDKDNSIFINGREEAPLTAEELMAKAEQPHQFDRKHGCPEIWRAIILDRVKECIYPPAWQGLSRVEAKRIKGGLIESLRSLGYNVRNNPKRNKQSDLKVA